MYMVLKWIVEARYKKKFYRIAFMNYSDVYDGLRLRTSTFTSKPMSKINPETTPLHTLNPLNRFSDRAEDYVKYRPSYPADAIDIILKVLG